MCDLGESRKSTKISPPYQVLIPGSSKLYNADQSDGQSKCPILSSPVVQAP